MSEARLSRLEFQIMETLWSDGVRSIRDIQESFPKKKRPAYTTVQTMVYRLEEKGVVRRVGKVGNFHVFDAAISRESAQGRLIDDLLSLFGGRSQPVMARLVETGKLTLSDIREAERLLKDLADKGRAK